MKRLLAIILTVLMLVSALPLTAIAATIETDKTSISTYTVYSSCSEEEFKKGFSEFTIDSSAIDAVLATGDISPKGFYYTFITDSVSRAAYDSCYGKVDANNRSTSFTSNFLNGQIYVDEDSPEYSGSAFESAYRNFVKKMETGIFTYWYDNVSVAESYGSRFYYSVSFSSDDYTGKIVKTTVRVMFENHQYYNSSIITLRDQRIREIAAKASQKATTYEKLKAIHDELVLTSYYDERPEALSNMYETTEIFYYAHSSMGVLNNGVGVCESYAKAFKLICDYMGLAPTYCFLSNTHMWNLVLLDDQWYCVDVTWDDPIFVGQDPSLSTYVGYNYFLCGDPDVVDGNSTDHVPRSDFGVYPQYASTAYQPSGCVHEIVKAPDVPATCSKAGSTGDTYCKHCGEVFEKGTTIAKKPHTSAIEKGKAATCTATGKTDREYCSVCGTTITPSTTIPKKAHTTTYISALAPTYTAAGYISHYKCTSCNGLFSDSTAKNQITPESIVVPKLTPPVTCTHDDTEVIPAVPATNESNGLTAGKVCADCGHVIAAQQEISRINTIKIDKTSYAYTGSAIKPGVVVKDIAGNTIGSSNYTVTYSSGLKLPGTYTITVKFKGNYSGTHKLSYKIIINKPSPKASTTTSSVKLSWGKVSGASGYVVYDANKKTLKDTKTTTSYTISSRKAGTTYTYYVRAYKTISGKKYYSDYVKITSSTLPANPKLSASSNTSTIKVSWGKVTGATGYVVYNSSKGTIKDCGNTTSLYINSLKSGTTYTYYVRAYRTVEGKRYYSSYVKVTYSTKPVTPKVSASTTTSSVKLSWGKVTGASGYIVYDANKKKLSDRKTSTSYTISSRKAGTTYTYYVRAYRKISSTTLYSDYVKITSSTLPANPKLSASSNASTIKVSWGKVTGATGYVVYNSSKATIKDCGNTTSLYINSLKAGTSYTYYVRAYRTVEGKRYYSSYVKVTYATKPTFNENSVTMGVGKTYKLALNTSASKVTWSTSNKSVATVSSAGVVTGKKAGTATITATANGQKATIKVTVAKVSIKLNQTSLTFKGKGTEKLIATVAPSGMVVNWESSNEDVATVDSNGNVTAVSHGTAVITAYIVCGGVKYSATCSVSVVDVSIKLNKTNITLQKNNITFLEATTSPRGQTVNWRSSDTSVATVSDGRVTAVSTGTAVITAWFSYQGVTYSATCTVTVEFVAVYIDQINISLQPRYTYNLIAVAYPSGSTIYWKSSNEAVATVDSNGKVTGIAEGETEIYAYIIHNGKTYKSATCYVTVEITTYSEYGYDEVPDFAGAVGGGLTPKQVFDRTTEIEFLYDSVDIDWDGESDLSKEIYRSYLKTKGFSYVTTQTGVRDGWTYSAEYYQNTTTKTRMIFVLWDDGDVSVVMWHY